MYCGKDDKGQKLAEATRKKQGIKRYEKGEVVAGMKFKRSEFKRVKELANWFMILPTVHEKKNYKRRV